MIKLLHFFLFGNVNNAGPIHKGHTQFAFIPVSKRVLSHNTIYIPNNNLKSNKLIN